MTIIDDLRKQIADCENRIKAIQSECQHPETTIRVLSIGRGEYPDEVWRNCVCGLCDGHFRRAFLAGGQP